MSLHNRGSSGASGTGRSLAHQISQKPAVTCTIAETRRFMAGYRQGAAVTAGPVGLVPTMGFFHEGHLSLMKEARAANAFVAVSIFINPTQFGADEDLGDYPRDLDRDLALAAEAGVDLVFSPSGAEMYPPGHESAINVGGIAEGLCGRGRPGHFTAVATVVAKLFNIIGPDRAYFGQKDAQQLAVIRRMAADLDFPTEIVACPTVRDQDGLALSSRNSYLSDDERRQATSLHQALALARDRAAAGETSAVSIKRLMRRTIAANYLVELEYASVVDPLTLKPVREINGEALAAVAARVGRARLIDNTLLTTKG